MARKKTTSGQTSLFGDEPEPSSTVATLAKAPKPATVATHKVVRIESKVIPAIVVPPAVKEVRASQEFPALEPVPVVASIPAVDATDAREGFTLSGIDTPVAKDAEPYISPEDREAIKRLWYNAPDHVPESQRPRIKEKDPIPDLTHSDATFGAEVAGGPPIYRFDLMRWWGDGPRRIVNFIMLNPSTAGKFDNDNTTKKCIGFADRWGFNSLVLTNLYAFRATDPKDLFACGPSARAIGPANDEWIMGWAKSADLVVVAWSAHGHQRGRGAEVLGMLLDAKVRPHYFRLCDNGQPWHPLYVPYTEALSPIARNHLKPTPRPEPALA